MRWLCLIGDPVERSLSPEMHNAALLHLGLDHDFMYVKRRVAQTELSGFMRGLDRDAIAGLSVTMPHKAAVMPHLDVISPEAEQAGAVNTVVCRKGELVGRNTDGHGCVMALQAAGITIRDSIAVLIGAGGAARAAAFALAGEGILTLNIVNRTPERARALAMSVGKAFDIDAAWGGISVLPDALAGADMLVNATPWADQSIPLTRDMAVLDMAYGQSETLLIHAARHVGAIAIPGTEMLLRQGALQFELFTDRAAPVGVMRAAMEQTGGSI